MPSPVAKCPVCREASCYHCWECHQDIFISNHAEGCQSAPSTDKGHISEFQRVLRERARRKAAKDKPLSEKVAYVKSQTQTRDHECHWPGCDSQVPPALWGCKRHWYKLPKKLRVRVWAAYAPGQEVNMTPSRAYLAVAKEVQDWIKANYTCRACKGSGKSSKGAKCFPCNGSGVQQ